MHTLKGQLDLERHGGHTPGDVIVRVLPPILALTAAIWRNDTTGQPVPRSLVAYGSESPTRLAVTSVYEFPRPAGGPLHQTAANFDQISTI